VCTVQETYSIINVSSDTAVLSFNLSLQLLHTVDTADTADIITAETRMVLLAWCSTPGNDVGVGMFVAYVSQQLLHKVFGMCTITALLHNCSMASEFTLVRGR
jgi:hypothetical protein